MRIAFAIVTLALAVSSCGSPDPSEGVLGAGTYVMGDPAKARKKTEPTPPDPNRPKTLRELFERSEKGETFTFSASVDILLELRTNGTFAYYGPLKMGDDQALIRGRWTCDGTAVHLRLDEPRTSKGEVVASLVCPYRPGVVAYPLGRDPENQVYYRLLDVARSVEIKPEDRGIRIGEPAVRQD